MHLHHVYLGKYVATNEINIDRAERKFCHIFFGNIWMGGKTNKLKKVGHITINKREESEDNKEEVEVTVLEDGGGDISIVTAVYPCGAVSVS